MGAGATGGALGIMGGILGGVGDIYKAAKYKRPQFPDASGQERRQRQYTMQDLANARKTMYEGEGLYNQTLPMMYNAIPGVEAQMEYDPQAQAEYEQAYGQLSNRVNLQDQLAGAKAERRAGRASGAFKGTGGRAAKQAARAKIKGVKQQVKGAPKLAELERSVYGRIAQGPKMKISKKAPTQTDVNEQQIQDALSQRTLAALRGETPNPTLEHNLTREQAHMQEQMMHQLGPDWQNSSAGIEAMNQFNQYANDQRDMSNRHDIEQMYQEQLGGQRAQYQKAGAMQGLLGQPSLGDLRFAQAGAGMAGAATQAQSPYQFDRQGQWAEQQNPSQIYGDMMAQSGNRWASIGSSMGGGGGGGGAGAAPSGGQPAQPDTVNVPSYGGYGS